MAPIGTVKKTGSNEYTGEIVTLGLQAKNVRIVPDARATGELVPPPGSPQRYLRFPGNAPPRPAGPGGVPATHRKGRGPS